jgi:hypothetical protein
VGLTSGGKEHREAFSGFCMELVQSAKTAGNITVEVTAPGGVVIERDDRGQGGDTSSAGCCVGA